MINSLITYLSYPFVRNALIVGILISLCSSILGVFLVLKRLSFIGDGLSHVAFGAIAISAVLNITNNMLIVLPITIICAVLIIKSSQNLNTKGDAAIAMMSVSALAIGYLLLNIFSSSSNINGDVCSTLFGSSLILSIDKIELIVCIVLSILVLIAFILFYNKFFIITFDENFAKSRGINSELYNFILAIITAIIIVLAMNLVGSLLISAILVFPALSAMKIVNSFKGVIIFASIISVICSSTGIILSIILSTPVGATIVAVNIFAYLICSLFNKVYKK